jgi:hypothetical protein
MAGSLSDYAENKLLDHVLNAAYAHAATVYLALCTADPTDAGTGAACNEVADANGYTRKAITFTDAAARAIAQTGAVTFDAVSGAGYGPVTHWAVLDNGTHGAGNMLAYGDFAVAKSMVAGNTPSVASGQVTITFSAGEISDYLAIKLLDLMFRNIDYAKPETWIALATDDIIDGDDGAAMDECTGGSYARVQVNINAGAAPSWDLAASGIVDNAEAITFPTATGSWGTVKAVAIMDSTAEDGGNVLFYDNTLADQAVTTGDTVSFAIGALDILIT